MIASVQSFKNYSSCETCCLSQIPTRDAPRDNEYTPRDNEYIVLSYESHLEITYTHALVSGVTKGVVNCESDWSL